MSGNMGKNLEGDLLKRLLEISGLKGYSLEFWEMNPDLVAGAKGKRLVYGKGLLELPDDEQIAILLHEMAHSLFESLEEKIPMKEIELMCDGFAKSCGYGEALIRNFTREEELDEYFDHPTWKERIEALRK